MRLLWWKSTPTNANRSLWPGPTTASDGKHPHPVSEVTHLLAGIQRGDPKASDELFTLVYDELRRMAAVRMAQEVRGQTLQPTALVHEAWLRLAGDTAPKWQNRAHFFGA